MGLSLESNIIFRRDSVERKKKTSDITKAKKQQKRRLGDRETTWSQGYTTFEKEQIIRI